MSQQYHRNKIQHDSCRALAFALLITMALTQLVSCQLSETKVDAAHSIVVDADISTYFHRPFQQMYTLKEEMDIKYQYFPYSAQKPVTYANTSKLQNDKKVTWVLPANGAACVFPPFGLPVLLRPGDSLHINYLYDYPIYTGKNNPAIDMLSAIMKTEDRLLKPIKKNTYNAKSLEDYLDWNNYLNQKTALQMPILMEYKSKISLQEYVYYATYIIGSIEGDRVNAFHAMMGASKENPQGLTAANLCQIWDSTQNKPVAKWLRSFTTYYGSVSDLYAFNRMEVFRHFGFDTEHDSLVNKDWRTYAYYTTAKQKYDGLTREQLLGQILDESTISELGLKNPTAQAMLQDYYSMPGYPEYKQIVKNLEEVKRKKEAEKEKKEKAEL